MLVIINLKHQSLRMVNSLKITSFRVCNFALLLFADKEFSPFSDPYSSSSKGNSGLCEAAELYGRNSHHEGATFANVLQITENQFKGTYAKYFWFIYSLWKKNLAFSFHLVGFPGFSPIALFFFLFFITIISIPMGRKLENILLMLVSPKDQKKEGK